MNNDIGDIIRKQVHVGKIVKCDENIETKWNRFEYYYDLDVESESLTRNIKIPIRRYVEEEILLNGL